MSTPSGPYEQTPPPSPAGEHGQNPPHPGYQPYPAADVPPGPGNQTYPGYQTYPGGPAEPNPYGPPAPGMPVYPQPPYPPQQYGPPYPGYPPPLPQQRSNRTLWIILSVVGGVLLCVCVACCGLLFLLGSLGSQFANSPFFVSSVVVTTFCGDERNQDYHGAYTLLSANLRSQISEIKFVQDNQTADATKGPVTACTLLLGDQTSAPTSSATTQSFTLSVTRGFEAGSAGGAGGTGSGTPGASTPGATPSATVTSGKTPTSTTPTSTAPSGATPSATTIAPTSAVGTITLVKENGSWKIDDIDASLGLL